ncbi:MAG: NAD(P)-dependent oxidoreductase [Chloroflexi bacterium]|nr:NAD(P)-dependent oxidoreductase [Chloroflexota bacterium]
MASRRDSRVGFVGVGKLGRPMAQRILRAGHDLLVFDIEAAAKSAFHGTTAEVATSLTELASECGIVCLCLPGPAEVEQVVLGRDGIGSTVRPGTLVVDHTTNSPTVVRQVGEQLRLRGAAMVDAPVSGGIEGAAAGTLTTLIGGEPEHVERARPLLKAFSTAIVHVGPLGAGTVAKLMNNLATFALDQVIGECLTIGARAGIEPDRLLEALQQSAIGKGGNLHVRMPDTFMKGDFEPRFTLAGAHKDVRLAVGLAEESGVPIRIARTVLDEIESALSKGLGDRDASIVMTLQEERAGVHISSRSHAS